MTMKLILDEVELPKYKEGSINRAIIKNIKYGNPIQEYQIHFVQLKDPILKWKKFLKLIPKPQDYRSTAVKKEILYLKNLQDSVNKKYVKRINEHDRSNIDFVDLIRENGYSVSERFYKKMNVEIGHIIIKLKMHYQRPRPYQIAHYHNIKFNPIASISAWSPSYPSGHGFHGYFWAKFFSYKYPDIKKKIKKFGKEMADSRLYGGFHYPSDNLVSKQLVNIIFKKKIHLYLEKKVKEKYNL